MDRGAWWATVHGVPKDLARLNTSARAQRTLPRPGALRLASGLAGPWPRLSVGESRAVGARQTGACSEGAARRWGCLGSSRLTGVGAAPPVPAHGSRLSTGGQGIRFFRAHFTKCLLCQGCSRGLVDVGITPTDGGETRG